MICNLSISIYHTVCLVFLISWVLAKFFVESEFVLTQLSMLMINNMYEKFMNTQNETSKKAACCKYAFYFKAMKIITLLKLGFNVLDTKDHP